MLTKSIRLDTVDKVKHFTAAISNCSYEADITSGRYVVDAHSIMGIFSLDLTKPLELVIHDKDMVVNEEDVVDFLHEIKDYIVNA